MLDSLAQDLEALDDPLGFERKNRVERWLSARQEILQSKEFENNLAKLKF